MTLNDYITNLLPTMEGWCTQEKATKLAEIVTKTKPSIIVEIGVFAGKSLFAMALAQQAIGYGSRLTIGIDPWKVSASTEGFTDENADWWGKLDHESIYRLCRLGLEMLGLQSECHLLRSTSADALSLIQRLPPINIAHIDGNHSPESALFDVQAYAPLVPPGGTILFDDLDWATTRKAQAYLATVARLDERLGNCGIYTKL